jgi:His/Glu/Gln/Arg/opine family amino acid ABC transporter permease subunit
LDPTPETQSFFQFSFETVLPRLVEGMAVTLELTIWSAVCGILLGLALSLARISQNRLISNLAGLYVTVMRGTPLLLQILFIYFALPPLLDIRLEAKPAGILALSLNGAAYLTEIFRAAIQSIDKGQMEAARALGMSYGLAMRRIILPQTFRRLLPPVVNEMSALAKDTSLVSVIALSELLYVTQRLGAKYLRPWEVYFWAAVGYLSIVVALSTLAGHLERRLAKREA